MADTKHQPIAVIGAGHLGSAIIRGLLRSGAVPPAAIIACNRNRAALESLRTELGVTTEADAARAVELACRESGTILLSVKPVDVSFVLEKVRSSLVGSPLLISVVAGITAAQLEERVGGLARIARAIPNLPSLVGQGVTGIYASDGDDTLTVTRIFSSIGSCVSVAKESELDAITALAASGAGFMFLLLDAFADGGVKLGLSREQSTAIAAQTMLGSAVLLLESGDHPAKLRDQVASPKGTTVAGLHVLESAAVRGAIIAALEASWKRAGELAAGKG